MLEARCGGGEGGFGWQNEQGIVEGGCVDGIE